MKKIILSCIFCFNFFVALCQEDTLTLIKKFPIHGEAIVADNLGDFYIIHKSQLKKYNSKGQLQNSFSKKNLGQLNSCDASNPFKILLFYKEQNSIVFLDKSLSLSGEPLQLENMDFFDVSAACNSEKGGFWIFDTDKQELAYFNNNLQPKFSSESSDQLTGIHLEPKMMIEKSKFVYILDSKKGLYIFDGFANYYKNIPIENVSKAWVTENYFVFFRKNRITFLQSNMLQELNISLAEKDIVDICLKNRLLYVLTPTNVEIYEVKLILQ